MRQPKKKNNYFTAEHEAAIVRYCKSIDKIERERLYRSLIGPGISEMVDKICYTFKFTSLPNVKDLQDECKTWLVTILEKFEPDRGYKAFSYFSVITKNWFIHQFKKNAALQQKEIQCAEIPKDIEHQYLSQGSEYSEEKNREEYFEFLVNEIDLWQIDLEDLKDSEKRVMEAIRILLKNIHEIDIFNKKAFYIYIREITGLNTKQIVQALIRIKEKYVESKKIWDNGNG